MTKLVWTIELAVNSTYTVLRAPSPLAFSSPSTHPQIRLNSTVFHTLNTSGVAPGTGDGIEVEMPQPPLPAERRSDVLVLHHHGHDTPHTYCTADWDGAFPNIQLPASHLFEH